ncbi:hypothetical protein HHI36_010209 [Cryptolaemus montrouzieri]|uniref:Alpha-N-acetylglucosaminidase C-terminal domain-containing protein n=1 Tax=Cryptolaemus montrouzieri TaxID=559131 RepID=A0ABD2MIA4_9CUCU
MFLNLMNDLETVLATNKAFLLSEWVKSARQLGSTPEEKDWFEYNARNQITLWGPNGEIMNYAIKQWSGVVSDFLLPRWKVFLEYSNETLVQNESFNDTYIKEKMFEAVEEPFTFKKSVFLEGAKGDIIDIVTTKQEEWIELFDKLTTLKKKDLNGIFISNFSDLRGFTDQVSFTDFDDIGVEMVL